MSLGNSQLFLQHPHGVKTVITIPSNRKHTAVMTLVLDLAALAPSMLRVHFISGFYFCIRASESQTEFLLYPQQKPQFMRNSGLFLDFSKS